MLPSNLGERLEPRHRIETDRFPVCVDPIEQLGGEYFGGNPVVGFHVLGRRIVGMVLGNAGKEQDPRARVCPALAGAGGELDAVDALAPVQLIIEPAVVLAAETDED